MNENNRRWKMKIAVLTWVMVSLTAGVALAGTESYLQCRPDTARNAAAGLADGSPNSWIVCPMTNRSACGPGDWSMQLNIQSSGFTSCSLTIEGGVGMFEFSLAQRNPSEHATCSDLYTHAKASGHRFLRCRSNTGALPTNFSVQFGTDASDCL